MKLTMAVIVVGGFYGCYQLWGGAGIVGWLGICVAFGLVGVLTDWAIALGMFIFGLGCAALLFGGLTFAARRWGGVGAFVWTVAFIVFLYVVPIRWLKKSRP
jgi:hypothetical protein